MTSHCRWGILGTANIARKNWRAMRVAGNSRITAVASRSTERAEEFIRSCSQSDPVPGGVAALGSYEELISHPEVDAIYIPLPTGLRKPWVIRAAEAGKHVLVEKPVGVTADDVREMLDACKRSNVQFMDGVMFMHSRRLDALRQTLCEPETIGQLRRITSQFSFQAPEEFLKGNIRMHGELEPYGCLGDLGWYNVRLTLWVMNYEMPVSVRGTLIDAAGSPDSPSAVPMEFSAELQFKNGVSAGFYCSFQTEIQQWAHLSGTAGSLLVRDFVLPFYGARAGYTVSQPRSVQTGCDFDMIDCSTTIELDEYSNGRPDSQEVQMIRTFSQLVLDGRIDPSWGEIAIKTQRVLDACLASARNGCALIALGD